MMLETASSKFLGLLLLVYAISAQSQNQNQDVSHWIKIDDFESASPLQNWTLIDTQNETNPRIENPQVTEVRDEDRNENSYLIKNPPLTVLSVIERRSASGNFLCLCL